MLGMRTSVPLVRPSPYSVVSEDAINGGSFWPLKSDTTTPAKAVREYWGSSRMLGKNSDVGGSNTSAHAILKLAGAENVAQQVNGFRPLPDEAIVELAPEVIVAMRRSSGNDAHDTDALLSLKSVQSTPAGAAKRLILMDGLYLLGFGPRAPAAARDLMGKLYPELAGTGTNATR